MLPAAHQIFALEWNDAAPQIPHTPTLILKLLTMEIKVPAGNTSHSKVTGRLIAYKHQHIGCLQDATINQVASARLALCESSKFILEKKPCACI